MTFEDFEKLLDKMVEEERGVRTSKGKEYAGTGDRLGNFKRLSDELGISPEAVCFIYFKKHVDSIASYIRNNGKVFSNEAVEGRILDARVYLSLLRAIIEERK